MNVKKINEGYTPPPPRSTTAPPPTYMDLKWEFESDTGILSWPGTSDFKLCGEVLLRTLIEYQLDGIKCMWFWHNWGKGGGILGDDMGLGKTLQICCFLKGLFFSNLIQKVLIVAPVTVLQQWQKELHVVHLQQMTKEYYKDSKESRKKQLQHIVQHGGVLLTTFDTVARNYKPLKADGIKWDYVIIDEGHMIKNPETMRSSSLDVISRSHNIIMSGTPIQNNLEELWTLYNFCCPNLLGNRKRFEEKYEVPILLGNKKDASDEVKSKGSEAAKNADLRAIIQPHFLRRKKSDVLELPQKREVVVWLQLTDTQRILYDEQLRSYSDAKNKNIFATLMVNLVVDGHYVLVFSHSNSMLNYIEKCIKLERLDFLRMDGSTRNRDEIIENFEKGGEAHIFLLASKVGGVGITLIRADYVIIVDPDWNPSVDNQSVDRAFRMGQTKEVFVYRLITCGSIEEKIYRRQIFKEGLFRAATEPQVLIQYFSDEDLKDLLDFKVDELKKCVTKSLLDNQHKTQTVKNDKYLQNEDIIDVTNHSILYSKTPPVLAFLEEEEEMMIRSPLVQLERFESGFSGTIIGVGAFVNVLRNQETENVGTSTSHSAQKHFERVKLEKEIWELDRQIKRKEKTYKEMGFSSSNEQLLANKTRAKNEQMLGRNLPDGGERAYNQIRDMKLKLVDVKKKVDGLC
ncbi:hypothetical protein OROGR_018216 [Orobanche gracilis]